MCGEMSIKIKIVKLFVDHDKSLKKGPTLGGLRVGETKGKLKRERTGRRWGRARVGLRWRPESMTAVTWGTARAAVWVSSATITVAEFGGEGGECGGVLLFFRPSLLCGCHF